jgi:hypothetical protein
MAWSAAASACGVCGQSRQVLTPQDDCVGVAVGVRADALVLDRDALRFERHAELGVESRDATRVNSDAVRREHVEAGRDDSQLVRARRESPQLVSARRTTRRTDFHALRVRGEHFRVDDEAARLVRDRDFNNARARLRVGGSDEYGQREGARQNLTESSGSGTDRHHNFIRLWVSWPDLFQR